MKWLNQLKSKSAAVVSVFSVTALFGSQAFAAFKDDIIQAGGLVLIALVAVAAFRYIRRAF